MLDLGTVLPPFKLTDISGKTVTDRDFGTATALVVAFICPHCPFVQHVRGGFVRFAGDYQPRGVAIVAINSNDTKAYPQDGLAGMKAEAAGAGFSFPYLFDETQQVAKEFRVLRHLALQDQHTCGITLLKVLSHRRDGFFRGDRRCWCCGDAARFYPRRHGGC